MQISANYRKKPEIGIKEGFEEMEHEYFPLEHSGRENETTFSGVPFLKEIFPLKRPKKSSSIYSPTGFLETTILNSKRQVKGKRCKVVTSKLIGRNNHYSSTSLCGNISAYLDDILTFQ